MSALRGKRIAFAGRLLSCDRRVARRLVAQAGGRVTGTTNADFLVVGAYPPGQYWDLCRGAPGERPQTLENIARVPLPPTDPIYGQAGPLLEYWQVG